MLSNLLFLHILRNIITYYIGVTNFNKIWSVSFSEPILLGNGALEMYKYHNFISDDLVLQNRKGEVSFEMEIIFILDDRILVVIFTNKI